MKALFMLIPMLLTAPKIRNRIIPWVNSLVACPLLSPGVFVLTSSLGMYLINWTAIAPMISGATQKIYTCLQFMARDPTTNARLMGPSVIPRVPPAPCRPSAFGRSFGLNRNVVKL